MGSFMKWHMAPLGLHGRGWLCTHHKHRLKKREIVQVDGLKKEDWEMFCAPHHFGSCLIGLRLFWGKHLSSHLVCSLFSFFIGTLQSDHVSRYSSLSHSRLKLNSSAASIKPAGSCDGWQLQHQVRCSEKTGSITLRWKEGLDLIYRFQRQLPSSWNTSHPSHHRGTCLMSFFLARLSSDAGSWTCLE